MKHLLLLLLFPVFTSCVANGPSFSNSVPEAGKGRIVVYRVPSTPAGRAADVMLDGKKGGRLKMKGYLAFEVQPGSHVVGVTFEKSSTFADVTPASQKFKLGNGETVFLRYSTQAAYKTRGGIPVGSLIVPDYIMLGILSPRSEAQALQQVSRYKMGELSP